MTDLFEELNQMPGGNHATAPNTQTSGGKPASPALKQSAKVIENLGELKGDALTHRVELCDPNHGQLQVLQDDEYLKPFENDLKMRQHEFLK